MRVWMAREMGTNFAQNATKQTHPPGTEEDFQFSRARTLFGLSQGGPIFLWVVFFSFPFCLVRSQGKPFARSQNESPVFVVRECVIWQSQPALFPLFPLSLPYILNGRLSHPCRRTIWATLLISHSHAVSTNKAYPFYFCFFDLACQVDPRALFHWDTPHGLWFFVRFVSMCAIPKGQTLLYFHGFLPPASCIV